MNQWTDRKGRRLSAQSRARYQSERQEPGPEGEMYIAPDYARGWRERGVPPERGAFSRLRRLLGRRKGK